MDVDGIVRPVGRFLSSFVQSDRLSRRVWAASGRAHIEVRGLGVSDLGAPDGEPTAEGTAEPQAAEEQAPEGPPDAQAAKRSALQSRLKQVLESVKGVNWAQVNAVTGRVIVAYDDESLDVADLVDIISEVEDSHDVAEERFPGHRPEHPGDSEPLQRSMAAAVADTVGLALSIFGRVLETAPIPMELASIATFIDSTPRLRRVVEERLGRSFADVGLAVTNAAAQALAQGPVGLVLDLGHRVSQITEIESRRAAWARREPDLVSADHGLIEPIHLVPRPEPLRPGPLERYTDRASLVSLAACGVTLVVSRNIRTAGNALLAGMPKAARMGREAFAAQATRVLADRGVVVLDPGLLRRLDRVDTVVVDAEVLVTGRFELEQVVATGGMSQAEARMRAHRLFDPDRPDALCQRGRWTMGPLAGLEAELPRGARSQARTLGAGRSRVLGLATDGTVVALARVDAALDPLSDALVGAVAGAGLTLVLAGPGAAAERLGKMGRRVAGGRRLASEIRALQGEGHTVMVIGRNSKALQASDCGVGLLAAAGQPPANPPPWGADLLAGPGLDVACLIVEAASVARRTSQTAVWLALAGSAVGAASAVVSPPGLAAPRTLLAVNGAAMLSLGVGTWAGAGLARHRVVAPAATEPWHELDTPAALSRLGTSTAGLDQREVGRRQRAAARGAGPGVGAGAGTSGNRSQDFANALVQELSTPLTPILGVGAAMSAAVGSVADSLLVGGVTVANAVIGAAQRVRTEQALQRLIDTTAVKVRVRRDGSTVELPPEALVPGDIVLLGHGELVPADCRIVKASALEVDESSLSGESVPVSKQADPCPGAVVTDRTCMLYQGSTVVAGTAVGAVVAVGAATEAGRVLLAGGQPPPTGVEHRLQRLTAVTVPACIASGGAVVASSLLRGHSVQAAIGSGIGLTVASVPEGLPLLAGVAQLASARRLAERHVLVRNPASVEALGRVDTLCFDKTGTVTEGRIALRHVGDGQHADVMPELGDAARRVLRIGLRASPSADESGAVAHATDEAVVKGAEEAGVGPDEPGGSWTRVDELPFETARGFHAVAGRLQRGADPPVALLAVKGAPEVLLGRCRIWTTSAAASGSSRDGGGGRGGRGGDGLADNGGQRFERRPLHAAARRQLDRRVEGMARRGLRVLAVAERHLPPSAVGVPLTDELVDDLELVGFLGLADPARPSAAAAVAGLRRAGVEVAMITGDHPSTAEAIASEVGILNGRRTMTGAELDALDDAALAAVLPEVSVFARVTPAHKVRIVEGLQRAGRVVAMTGDGANDAPAIRLAHAGIAVGQRGAAPARAAADLVVTDDRIETLVDAIVEGRAMWSSVRDALGVLMGGNLGEVAFTVGATAVTGESPLNARQLLLVNLLTDLFPAMAIAVRPPRGMSPEALLHEGPEASLGNALVRDIVGRGATTASGAGVAWALARATGPARRASTVGLVALVGTQLGQTLLSGTASPLVIGTSLASGLALAAIVQTPGLSHLFGCTPLDPIAWLMALGPATTATVATAVLRRQSDRPTSSIDGPSVDGGAATPLPA